MSGWDDPGGSSLRGALPETARIVAVVAAALVGGAGLLGLITQVLAPAPPRVTVPPHGRTVAGATPAPTLSLAPLPTLPETAAPPAATGDGAVPDQYLGDLTSDGGTNPGEIDGLDYRFSHGFGMFLRRTTQARFVVPAGYQSLTATLKGLGGTIRFTLSLGGRTILDQTLSPYQPPLTVTCATPEGATVVLAGLFQAGGSLSDAVAVWGDARFSPSPAPAAGCSSL